MGFRPMGDRILVQRDPEEPKTKGGLHIPDTAKEKPVRGKIVAAGKGRLGKNGKRLAMEVRVGDQILFSRFGGTEVNVDGTDYLVLGQEDVLGILNENGDDHGKRN